MQPHIDADRGEAAEVEVLEVGRARLQDDLILVIMLEPVGILAVAAVGGGGGRAGRKRRFQVSGPSARKRRRGVERARPHLHVVGLEDQAAVAAPVIVERQDHALEG